MNVFDADVCDRRLQLLFRKDGISAKWIRTDICKNLDIKFLQEIKKILEASAVISSGIHDRMGDHKDQDAVS